MNHFLNTKRGGFSVGTILLLLIASIAIIALTYKATQVPTKPKLLAQTGRCFWIEAEFERRADGAGYDPYVFFKSDDNNGFDDIYLTRDGRLVAGPNKWNKSNGPFVFYPQYTGGVLSTGQTISFTGRDDNCGARGNSSQIACSVDQNGNLVQTGYCKLRGGGGNPPPTSAPPTQPPQTQGQTRLYIEPNTVNKGQGNITVTATGSTNCSTNITNFRDQIPNAFSSCSQSGGFSCSGNPKDGNSCWWRWNCAAIQNSGTFTVNFNSSDNPGNCASSAQITVNSPPIGQPQPTNTPTRIPHTPTTAPDICDATPEACFTPTPTRTPTPTATPPPPPNTTCGYQGQTCCNPPPQGAPDGCFGDNLVCTGILSFSCQFITPTPPPPTATPIATPTTAYVDPGTPERLAAPIIDTGKQIINRLTGQNNIQPTPSSEIGSISGNVKVNNSTDLQITATKVALYKTKGEANALPADASSGSFQYNGLPTQEYFIKAWVRDQNGNWYQNTPCTPVGDDYDCTIKPGDNINLTVNIGPQGLRGLISKTQNSSTNIAQSIKEAVINLPVVGGFINIFIISAF